MIDNRDRTKNARLNSVKSVQSQYLLVTHNTTVQGEKVACGESRGPVRCAGGGR